MKNIISVKKYLLIGVCVAGACFANNCYANNTSKTPTDISEDPQTKALFKKVKNSKAEEDKVKQRLERRKEEAEIQKEALRINQSKGDQDVYPEVEKRVMKKHNVSRAAAHEMIEKNDQRVKKIYDELVQESVKEDLEEARKIVKNRKRNE